MSVLIETSLGDLVVDLDITNCPKTSENFLKLCKSYRYNYLTFFSVQKDFIVQTGDPTNSGQGGQSIWSLLHPSSPSFTPDRSFEPERNDSLRHNVRGTISMACRRTNVPGGESTLTAGSQFFITLKDNADGLDDKHAPFGRIVEGDEQGGTLDKINAAFVDKDMRPLRDIRIQHVVVLDDPYEDPVGLSVPSRTPSPTPEQMKPIGLDASSTLDDDREKPTDQVEEERRKRDTNAAALTLEMVGDLPFAEVRPPENILFVCKLNPVTQSEDLELIFSRFGKIMHCEVIRDKRTGDSLQYAFIEFDEQKSAEQAYFKMQNVLVDDRRIWVDFSQSVSKLSSSWNTSRARGKPLKVTQNSSSLRKHDRSAPSYSRGTEERQRAKEGERDVDRDCSLDQRRREDRRERRDDRDYSFDQRRREDRRERSDDHRPRYEDGRGQDRRKESDRTRRAEGGYRFQESEREHHRHRERSPPLRR